MKCSKRMHLERLLSFFFFLFSRRKKKKTFQRELISSWQSCLFVLRVPRTQVPLSTHWFRRLSTLSCTENSVHCSLSSSGAHSPLCFQLTRLSVRLFTLPDQFSRRVFAHRAQASSYSSLGRIFFPLLCYSPGPMHFSCLKFLHRLDSLALCALRPVSSGEVKHQWSREKKKKKKNDHPAKVSWISRTISSGVFLFVLLLLLSLSLLSFVLSLVNSKFFQLFVVRKSEAHRSCVICFTRRLVSARCLIEGPQGREREKETERRGRERKREREQTARIQEWKSETWRKVESVKPPAGQWKAFIGEREAVNNTLQSILRLSGLVRTFVFFVSRSSRLHTCENDWEGTCDLQILLLNPPLSASLANN